MFLAPRCFFPAPLLQGMAEDGLPVPFPVDRSCVPLTMGWAQPQRAPSHPHGGHGDLVCRFSSGLGKAPMSQRRRQRR